MDNNIKLDISIEGVDFQEAAKTFKSAGMSVKEFAKSLDRFKTIGLTGLTSISLMQLEASKTYTLGYHNWLDEYHSLGIDADTAEKLYNNDISAYSISQLINHNDKLITSLEKPTEQDIINNILAKRTINLNS